MNSGVEKRLSRQPHKLKKAGSTPASRNQFMSRVECLFGYHKPKWIIKHGYSYYHPVKQCCHESLGQKPGSRDKSEMQMLIDYLNECLGF